MPYDAVIGFLEKVADTPPLQIRVRAAIAERGDFAAHELVEVAASFGFHFTATEFREALLAGGASFELSETELTTVVGGVAGLSRVKAPSSSGISEGGDTLPEAGTGSTESDSTSTGKAKPSPTTES